MEEVSGKEVDSEVDAKGMYIQISEGSSIRLALGVRYQLSDQHSSRAGSTLGRTYDGLPCTQLTGRTYNSSINHLVMQ